MKFEDTKITKIYRKKRLNLLLKAAILVYTKYRIQAMLKNIFFIFIFSISFICNATNENNPIGARSSAMANASVSFTDLWSTHHNQAGLGFVRTISGGVCYENRFLIKELSIKGGAIALPIKGGTLGIAITSFGYAQYNENKYSLSFAKAFGENFSIGIAMDYLNTKIAEGYGSKGVLAAEVGIIAKPLKNLTIGAHVFNPTRTQIAIYNKERIPTIFRLGANYNFSENVMLAVETEKDIQMKPVFKAGLEYKPVKEFYLRAGISTNPTLSSFGFGLNLKSFKIDFSANYHQVLGVSPQISLIYTMDQKKSNTVVTPDF